MSEKEIEDTFGVKNTSNVEETFGVKTTFVQGKSDEEAQRDKETAVLKKLLNDLTFEEMRFVEGFVKTMNASEAHKLTGRQVKDHAVAGYNMFKKEKVQTAVAIALKRRIEAVGLEETGVIMQIQRVFDEAMKSDKFDVALKAAELLGLHLGMFGKKQKQAENVGKALNNEKIREQILGIDPEEKEQEKIEKKGKVQNVLDIIQSRRNQGA